MFQHEARIFSSTGNLFEENFVDNSVKVASPSVRVWRVERFFVKFDFVPKCLDALQFFLLLLRLNTSLRAEPTAMRGLRDDVIIQPGGRLTQAEATDLAQFGKANCYVPRPFPYLLCTYSHRKFSANKISEGEAVSVSRFIEVLSFWDGRRLGFVWNPGLVLKELVSVYSEFYGLSRM